MTSQKINGVISVSATLVLHNYLRTEELNVSPEERSYCPPGYVDDGDENNGEWRNACPANALRNLARTTSRNAANVAKEMREILADYFITVGSVPFQFERASLI